MLHIVLYLRYPFSVKRPMGYLFGLVTTSVALVIITQSCTCILGLLIGMCSMITSLIQDLEGDLNHLHDNVQNVCNFVELHSRIKQLNHNFHGSINTQYINR